MCMKSLAFNRLVMGLVLVGASVFCLPSQARDVAPGKQPATPAAQGLSHKHYEASPMANQPGQDGQLAPRLQNLGIHTFPVSTRNKRAQLFINQGINLAYGF